MAGVVPPFSHPATLTLPNVVPPWSQPETVDLSIPPTPTEWAYYDGDLFIPLTIHAVTD